MKKFACLFFLVIVLLTNIVVAGQVTLKWDANEPAPEGYKVFARSGLNYDYENPNWSGPETTATLELPEGVTYNFVVRAFDGLLESPNSEEVNYAMPTGGIDAPNGFNVTRVIIININ